jgi:hypothetical protein
MLPFPVAFWRNIFNARRKTHRHCDPTGARCAPMAATSVPIPLPIRQLDGILMGRNEFLAALGRMPAFPEVHLQLISGFYNIRIV